MPLGRMGLCQGGSKAGLYVVSGSTEHTGEGMSGTKEFPRSSLVDKHLVKCLSCVQSRHGQLDLVWGRGGIFMRAEMLEALKEASLPGSKQEQS